MAYELVAYSSFPGTYAGFSSNLYVDTATNGVVKWQIRVMRDYGSLQPYNLFTDATQGPRFNYTVGSNSATGAAWTYDFRSSTTKTIASGQFNTTAATYSFSVTTNGKTPLGLAPNFSGTGYTGYVAPSTTYTATYNGNGATSGSTASTSYTNPPSTSGTIAYNGFSRSGYDFNGWNTAANGTGTSYSQGGSFTGNLTLYAMWSVAYVPTPAPSQPIGLNTSGITNARIILGWSTGGGVVSSYTLFLNGVSQGNVTSATNSYTFSGLASNTPYALGVRANGPDYSSGTSSVNATTLPTTFTVPNVIGQTQSVATNSLTSAGFGSVSPTLVTAGATASNNLRVISQSPVSGTTATAGDAASINVYNYLLPVPNILGLTETAANTALSDAGFLTKSSSLTTSGATVSNNLTVGSQTPTGGTQYNPASNVAFTIYNFLTAVPNVVGLNQDAALTTLTNFGFTSISTTLTDVGVTQQNAGTVKTQTPVNSATTYNPKNQSVSLVIYSLGVTGRRYSATSNSMVSLTTSKRYNGSAWVQTTVAKRYNGSAWVDIVN